MAIKKQKQKKSPPKKIETDKNKKLSIAVAKKKVTKTTVKKKVKKTVAKKKKLKVSAKPKYQGEKNFLASIQPYKIKKTERYMNARQKKHFIEILERWQSLLVVEQDRTADKLQDIAANFPDESDRATHEEGFTLELKTRERERRLLNKIDSAIESIDQNDYGYCNACGIEIGIRRLEARPTATRCIDCKTLEEIHEKQQVGSV